MSQAAREAGSGVVDAGGFEAHFDGSDLDKEDVCDDIAAGETSLAESGHGGIDVEFFRVITRPGAEPVRERFFWRYRMFPNKYLVGKGPPPTTAPPTTRGR